jgi:hypothetical protein
MFKLNGITFNSFAICFLSVIVLTCLVCTIILVYTN